MGQAPASGAEGGCRRAVIPAMRLLPVEVPELPAGGDAGAATIHQCGALGTDFLIADPFGELLHPLAPLLRDTLCNVVHDEQDAARNTLLDVVNVLPLDEALAASIWPNGITRFGSNVATV